MIVFGPINTVAELFAFRPLAPMLVGQLLLLVLAYPLVTELAKRRHNAHSTQSSPRATSVP